jgi:hypothetical protein
VGGVSGVSGLAEDGYRSHGPSGRLCVYFPFLFSFFFLFFSLHLFECYAFLFVVVSLDFPAWVSGLFCGSLAEGCVCKVFIYLFRMQN